MGIARLHLNLAELLSPFQTLAHRWLQHRGAYRLQAAGLRYVGIRPTHKPRTAGPGLASRRSAVTPVRVVRMVDADRGGMASGRLVISGRMEDVCAELDRLAALESRR